MSIAIASRYVRALADLVADQGDYRRTLQELEDFVAIYKECRDWREVSESPAVTLEQKTKVLKAIGARLGTSALTVNFLRVVLAHYRMGMIAEIHQVFRKTVNSRMGVAEVRVTSATRIGPAQEQALRTSFSRLTGKQVEFNLQLDPDLLGGLVVQIDSTVYDGSVRGELKRIRQQLASE